MFDTRPIGLIDSGIGGFTVLKEVQKRLPNENIVYLGDSYRMPYGELDDETIVEYADSDIRFLQDRGVKAILLACNTVSSKLDRLTAKVPLFSIVEAGCSSVLEAVRPSEVEKTVIVGLIATKATVRSQIYPDTLKRLTDQIRFIQHGTGTLASVINNYPEEVALLKHHIREAIDPLVQNFDIQTLLLGCTHYPIVWETIKNLYPALKLINPAARQVMDLECELINQGCLAPTEPFDAPETTIYTTGTMADLTIFKTMVKQLKIKCDRLQRCRLDID